MSHLVSKVRSQRPKNDVVHLKKCLTQNNKSKKQNNKSKIIIKKGVNLSCLTYHKAYQHFHISNVRFHRMTVLTNFNPPKKVFHAIALLCVMPSLFCFTSSITCPTSFQQHNICSSGICLNGSKLGLYFMKKPTCIFHYIFFDRTNDTKIFVDNYILLSDYKSTKKIETRQ